jgi:MoaA/NifB/PqqE/SkfB family radical SAM enzyme
LLLPFLNREISLAVFKNAFTPAVLSQIKYLLFCGHHGDSIYATEFLDIVRYVKENSSTRIRLITNGSYKKSHWWHELGSLLDDNDGVIFSIDGWDNESNNLYRVDSDFESILDGIRDLRSVGTCYINWSTIYFKFNEDKMLKIADIAKNSGCDTFQPVRSSKFDNRYLVNGVDPLKPVDPSHVEGHAHYHEKVVFRRDDPFTYNLNRKQHKWAKCLNGNREINVTIEGHVYPCGWFNTGYQQNLFVKKYADRISIHTRSIKEILEDPCWDELIGTFATGALPVCRVKCQQDCN